LRGLLLTEGREGKRGGDEREGRGEGRGGKRDRRRGEGGEGTGEEAFLVMWPRRLSALNPPLIIV